MRASRIEVNEALRIGFVDEIVDSTSDFEDAAGVVADDILTTAPIAVSKAKALTCTFDRWMGSDEDLRDYTLELTSEMRGSPEGQEGLSAFLEKRDPDWRS
tara:strand:- start:310 stop:612 length:303 start_codon:yes stop_codon:yes gene_type:complete